MLLLTIIPLTKEVNMITNIKGLEYGGKYHKWFWDPSINPEATIKEGLADCTCFVLGDVAHDGLPQPVKPIKNANLWHTVVTNGWSVLPFKKENVALGDIIEWTNGCHVARVTDIDDDGTIYISGSFYTGMHGKAYWNGGFDIRTFTSLKEMSDWMVENYPVRFFHHWSLENENSWVGYAPTYILKMPQTVQPVKRDTSKNQIRVLTNEQNIRTASNQVVGVASKGYYNVIRIVHSTKNDYDWYEVDPDRYIAGMAGRVIYYPKADAENDEIKRLRARVDELEKILKQINSLSNIE